MFEKSIDISGLNSNILSILSGKLDENINYIEKAFDIKIKFESGFIRLRGQNENDVEMANFLFNDLIKILKIQKYLDLKDVKYSVELIKNKTAHSLMELLQETILYTSMGKSIRAKTLGQKNYIDTIKDNDVVFGIGPAGTGKTYLAMAMAVRAFKNGEVNRIVLTRPAVEAGESLGFLPGDLQMKVDPYLRPLYDALFEMLGHENYNKYVEKNQIEVAPLAYMRGRTLDSSFVILDEAQNTTNEQMKMFLTRLGYGSKAIITGDITQTDLPSSKASGLKIVLNILKNTKGIGMVYLGNHDIVRHPLVQRIISAYDQYEKNKRK
ncbi:PhoH-like protein [Peptoniphilus sp. ING2-D1G]|nr:PhoH-like protein [Peptoniphilus sp. ING2-D1G]